jgi:hypothetical protein
MDWVGENLSLLHEALIEYSAFKFSEDLLVTLVKGIVEILLYIPRRLLVDLPFWLTPSRSGLAGETFDHGMKVGEDFGTLKVFQDLMGEERDYYRKLYEENDPRETNGSYKRDGSGALDEKKRSIADQAKSKMNPAIEKQLNIARAYQKALCLEVLSAEPFQYELPGQELDSKAIDKIGSLERESDEILKRLDSYKKAIDRSNADLLDWVLGMPEAMVDADADTWQDFENTVDWCAQSMIWLIRGGAVLGYFVITAEARPMLLTVQAAVELLDLPFAALKGATAILLSTPAVNGMAVDLLALEAFWYDQAFPSLAG